MSAYKDNLARLEDIAQENGWILNPDYSRIREIVGLMSNNLEHYGDYYCPGKQKNDPPIYGYDILCPCPEIYHEISQNGHCACQLFFASSESCA